ncbi:MAG: AI-2E family transporter [Isosphaeraceae bacterium]
METIRRRSSPRSTPAELTLLIFGIVAFLYFTGEILKPLALSFLISFALIPFTRLFERLGLPRLGAVLITVVIVLGFIVGISFVVGEQIAALAERVPEYQQNIHDKLEGVIQPGRDSTPHRLTVLVEQIGAELKKLGPPETIEGDPVQKVEVVQDSSFLDRVRSAVGPTLGFLGVSSFVFILVLFILVGREDLRDRIVGLFGQRQVGLTTRTMEEIGLRISRYLSMFAFMNLSFGVVVALGLSLIGLPYTVLWGSVAGLLRFIPYIGPTVGALLPLMFSFAHFEGWLQPLEVVLLFSVLEIVLNSYLEPVIYGKSTGVSALGLLIAALFWTWLWGGVGLFLSTPLTVCLAVLGKTIPRLRFLSTLLDEEADLDPGAQLYQRLIALDRGGSEEVVKSMLKCRRQVEVFDEVLIPTLIRAEYDASRGRLDETEQAFIWDVVGSLLEEIKASEQFHLDSTSQTNREDAATDEEDSGSSRTVVVGLGTEDRSDALALEMLKHLLATSGIELQVLENQRSPLKLVERLAEISPNVVVLSHLPPRGLKAGRYLVRRLRARFPDLEILVGRWGETSLAPRDASRLISQGASDVAFSLAEIHQHIIDLHETEHVPPPTAAPLPG